MRLDRLLCTLCMAWALQVQNKAAIAANATQHEIIQEAAERQREEEKAGKQLERVQQQMAERIAPVAADTVALVVGWHAVCKVRRPRGPVLAPPVLMPVLF